MAEDGSKDITITKAQMQKVLNGTETDEEKALRSFQGLDKYGVDGRGRIYRILYMLEETGYTVTENGTVIYSYDKETGVYVPADLIYEAKYPHTAGTNSVEDEDYYISANNIRRSIKGERYLDVAVQKTVWDGYLDDDQASATFKVHRYKIEGYRELDNINPETDPVTVTLVTTGGTVIDTLQVYPGTDVQVSVTFKEHTETKSVSIGSPYNQTLTVYYGPKETKLTNAVSITEDTTVTVTSLNAEDLDGGLAGIRLMDYVITTPAAPDTEYETENVTFTLNKAGGWITSPPLHLLSQETAEGETASREYVYTYEYWFEEISSNPDGFHARFFRHGTGTEVDSNNRISKDANVDAKNEAKPKFVVQKLWRGVDDPVDYPDITFDLYQIETDSNGYTMGQGRIAKRPDGTSYSGITLSYSANEDESYTWICPEVLPTKAANGNNLAYYVVENPSQSSGEGLVWAIYGYSHGNYHKEETGQGSHYVADDPTLASQPENAKIAGNDGCIVIHNTSSRYVQMDVQKQFFVVRDDGSWHNVTSGSDDPDSDVHKGIVLGFTVIRRILDMNGNVIRGWHDYGNEFRVGFDADGNPVKDDGGNEFCLQTSNAYSWEYTIMNGTANLENDVVGLPSYGVYEDENGGTIPVKYNYSYREIGVYSDLKGTPHPTWEWVSSPPNIYIDENGAGVDHFGLAFANHDGKRTVNYQASNITVDKRWLGQPDAQEVYVKIYRDNNSVTKEDFTKIIADDLRGYTGFEITDWQHYVDDASLIDTENNWIVIKSNNAGDWTTTVKTHRAPLMPGDLNTQGSAYRYYIEEVGYKDKDGNVHLVAEDSHALDLFETRYTRWDATTGTWLEAAVENPADAAILLGRSNTNRLQVMNAPMMNLTVTKKWYDTDGTTEKEPWRDSVSFMVKQIRTRWVDGAATDEQETVYLTAGADNREFTLHENGQTATLAANHTYHDTYNMTVTEDPGVEPWSIVISGLQRGYFDEYGHEWHCTYEIEEADALYSEIVYENMDLHNDRITIKNIYDENKAAVRVTKSFSGVDTLPAGFTITASYAAGENDTGSTVTRNLTPANARSGNGSAAKPYVWTISEVPRGNTVTFTETGYTAAGIDYAAFVNGDLYSGTGDPAGTAVAGDPSEDSTAVLAFENIYSNEFVTINIVKVNSKSGSQLDGAVFRMKKQEGNAFVNYRSPVTVNGSATIEKLMAGTYRLEEMQAPVGYMQRSDAIQFTVANGSVTYSGGNTDVTFAAGSNTFTVGNKPGVELPNTGGTGTAPFTAAGAALILLGGGILVRRKRRALKERGRC